MDSQRETNNGHRLNLELWARAQIAASISWPVSFLSVSSLAAFMDISEPSLPMLWLLSLVMGAFTALSSGLVVRRQVSSSRAWAVANLIGVSAALTLSYLAAPHALSPTGFAGVGLVSGFVASTAQSLALQRGQGKLVPVFSGAAAWGLAFLFGYLLEQRGSFGTLPFDSFIQALLLGGGVSVPFLLLLFLGLSPISKERAAAKPGITFS